MLILGETAHMFFHHFSCFAELKAIFGMSVYLFYVIVTGKMQPWIQSPPLTRDVTRVSCLAAWPSWQCHVLSQHCTINYAAAGSRKWSIGRCDHSPVLPWSADDGWWRYVLCLQAFRFPSTPTVNFVATVQFCQVTLVYLISICFCISNIYVER